MEGPDPKGVPRVYREEGRISLQTSLQFIFKMSDRDLMIVEEPRNRLRVQKS